MSVDYRCPWCGAEFEVDVIEEPPDTDYEVDCYGCGRTFSVSYYFDPIFTAATPDEMAVCKSGGNGKACPYWNVFDDCCWFTRAKGACVAPTNEGCPNGHVGGDRELTAFERHDMLGIV